MNYGDRIVAFVDQLLNYFELIKNYLDDALAFFEKLKDLILELVEYFKAQLETKGDKALKFLDEEHFFI